MSHSPWRRRAVVALGVGALGATGYVAQRRLADRWRPGEGAETPSGLRFADDVVRHMVPTSDGGKISVVESGSGPPIVLVHGITLGAEIWAPQFNALSSHHRVIALNQRGHGPSVAGSEGFSVERLGEDLCEVLEFLEVRGATLVGHSMGGMVSQLVAAREPGRLGALVDHLVLVATSAGAMVPGPAKTQLAKALSTGAGLGLGRQERRGLGLIDQTDISAWGIRATFGAHPDPAAVELTRSIVGAMSTTSLAALLGPLLNFDVTREISAITVPTTIVAGTRDLLTPPRFARIMAERIPGARLCVLEGCGHMIMLERSEKLNEVITSPY